MAAASHLTTGIYGTVQGQPPFQASTEDAVFTRFLAWDTPVQMSFPTGGTVFHPVSPGVQVGGTGQYIYSVIEIIPTGLTTPGQGPKYASNQSVSTLATNAG